MGTSSLNKRHRYAVGLEAEGGGISPIRSYPSQEQLVEGFRDFYSLTALRSWDGLVAVEKADSAEWDGARCVIMSTLMKRVMGEEDSKREKRVKSF